MKIDPSNSLRSTALRRAGSNKQSAANGFADLLTEETPAASGVNTSSALPAVDALLALQEVPDMPGKREQARQKAEALLQELDELRHALLLGRLSPVQIERLVRLAAVGRDETGDPRLDEIVADIELRAAVELAKLGR